VITKTGRYSNLQKNHSTLHRNIHWRTQKLFMGGFHSAA